MSGRALVIDAATGVIRRSVIAPPDMIALQVSSGESVFLIMEDDGLFIDDANIVVGEGGSLEAAPSAPSGVTVPAYDLAYIAV